MAKSKKTLVKKSKVRGITVFATTKLEFKEYEKELRKRGIKSAYSYQKLKNLQKSYNRKMTNVTSTALQEFIENYNIKYFENIRSTTLLEMKEYYNTILKRRKIKFRINIEKDILPQIKHAIDLIKGGIKNIAVTGKEAVEFVKMYYPPEKFSRFSKLFNKMREDEQVFFIKVKLDKYFRQGDYLEGEAYNKLKNFYNTATDNSRYECGAREFNKREVDEELNRRVVLMNDLLNELDEWVMR